MSRCEFRALTNHGQVQFCLNPPPKLGVCLHKSYSTTVPKKRRLVFCTDLRPVYSVKKWCIRSEGHAGPNQKKWHPKTMRIPWIVLTPCCFWMWGPQVKESPWDTQQTCCNLQLWPVNPWKTPTNLPEENWFNRRSWVLSRKHGKWHGFNGPFYPFWGLESNFSNFSP